MIARPIRTILYAAAFAAVVPALAVAGTLAAITPQAAIATRQANFKKIGGAMKALGDQLKGSAPDKNAMVAAARTIATTAPQQAKLFPAGSGPGAGVKTEALPAIWSDRANFDAQMAKLAGESAKLLAVTNGGDATAIRAQFKATGAVCSGCHRQFRADS